MGNHFLAGMSLLLIINLIWEWKIGTFSKRSDREKKAFFVLWGLAWIVVFSISQFPPWTSPRQWIDFVYKPLLLWLKHPA
ncbi:hypothetical protein [Paenibacillus sp. S-12]|uniref:hypothetical protein n=1 Tax=Paenibacillus sp. S-12 TaxID=3031371 RepID=UPI0025A0B681|nr:hypothetical protein [Paenibacillus sp. S-12]